ncbi:MAG: LysM domain/BON superfamily protein [Deltaproteobacteria bacterium ADurb.BinA179]|nr:LysM peptidoglycan-binding domain-containing protein [Bacteriovoracaceae bacterium]OPZ24729.1 MAG: LysM domain/BON superfamily protein [Deltaproteobacteria bacterium ADurb.BinA179]HOD71393.1 LysM peptidoglycan-binding domain-containing protein [Deltaproteobacteria bacterium]HPA84004.1 LysM peptidoglycan-binding domain-containing protein [Deltaproteobacteria bacterium]HPV28293.1 LysM peptidoglycan-binding domain-containing protein [Deltaproteobacteria bacterium]
MRRIGFLLMVPFILLGCSSNPSPDITGGVDDSASGRTSLERGLESMEAGLKAKAKGDDEEARNAFVQASRHFREADGQSRTIMHRTLSELGKIVEISGFVYAPKESFEALAIYLKMQNAYMDCEPKVLSVLEQQFNEKVLKVQEITVTEKQKRLEELGQEIAQKRKEIQTQSQTDIFEIYPTIYVVKKSDTLPSIAARHEIYNDSYMWPLIYKANRDQIKDPKVVYVGQDLKIPRDITVEEIIEARREAGAPEPEKIPKEAYVPRRKK